MSYRDTKEKVYLSVEVERTSGLMTLEDAQAHAVEHCKRSRSMYVVCKVECALDFVPTAVVLPL